MLDYYEQLFYAYSHLAYKGFLSIGKCVSLKFVSILGKNLRCLIFLKMKSTCFNLYYKMITKIETSTQNMKIAELSYFAHFSHLDFSRLAKGSLTRC
jgi:hypothetical protein